MRVWCAPLLLPPPPPPSASYLHLLQSFSQHASVLCLVFPAIFLLLPTTIVTFFLFFSSSLLLLIRKSEHTYSRGVYGERWGTDYSSLWSIEDGDEPEESAGWDRSRETHIIHRGLSKPPLPFLLSPLTLCLSLVCSLQEQPPHHFFRAAVPPPPSLSLPHPLFYPSPFLLLAPLWECSEGKRIVRGSCFFSSSFSSLSSTKHRIYYPRDGLQSDCSGDTPLSFREISAGWSAYGLDQDQLDLARFSGHHQQQHRPSLIGRSHQIPFCPASFQFRWLSPAWIIDSWSDRKGGRS